MNDHNKSTAAAMPERLQASGPSAGVVSTSDHRSPTRLHSQELFRHGSAVEIAHDGRIYQLRLTRHNKLILTA